MANDVDILSLAEVKLACGVTGSAEDTQLAMLVTAVSQQLDTRCGPVVQRAITSESHDGGHYAIRLTYTPVMANSSASLVEYDRTTATTSTLDTLGTENTNGFIIDGGFIRRRNSGTARRFPTGTGNILVNYIPGRYTATTTVGAKWKQAAAMLCNSLYRNVYASGTEMYPMIQDGDLGMEPGVWVKAMAMLQREAQAPFVG